MADTNVYKLAFVYWKDAELHCGGDKNVFVKAIIAETPKKAAEMLREYVHPKQIEIVSITVLAYNVMS